MKLDVQNEQSAASKRVFSLYTIVMLLIYAGYVAMDTFRISRADQFVGGLTPEELASIDQVATWVIGLEVSFAFLFLACSIITLYLFHKNEDIQLIRNYTVLNIGLFLVVGLLGAGLSFVLPVPMGNLIQIIFIPTYFLVALVLYVIYATRKMRKENEL